MADITMCSGEECKRKKTCYRFIAFKSPIQSFFGKPPIINGNCEHYWKIEK